MGISDRRQREKEQRRSEIIDAAERLFFSHGYEDVSMDEIANEVELNKATLYLYFKNKEALFAAIVLRGIRILQKKYEECMKTHVPCVVKVALMGQAYYQFSQEHPDYLRLIKTEMQCSSAMPDFIIAGEEVILRKSPDHIQNTLLIGDSTSLPGTPDSPWLRKRTA